MDKISATRLLLIAATTFLVFNTLLVYRDYQDSWVLEGIEIPYIVFVIAYAIAFLLEKNVYWTVILAALGRFVFLLIPNLKYAWFQGTAIDQQRQLALANHVRTNGYIFGGEVYGSSPLIHLLFSVFSMTSGLSVADVMKYLPVLLSPLYPLLTFVIIKNMRLCEKEENAIFKAGLFISSIPFNIQTYVVTGTQFGVLFAFLVLSGIIVLLQTRDRRYWLVILIFVFAVAAAHSVTSVLLSIFLMSIIAVQKALRFQPRRSLRIPAVLAVISISAAWLIFQSPAAMSSMLRTFFFAVPSGTTPGSEYVPARFFTLIGANPLAGLSAFLVYYGADAVLLLLSIGGLIVLIKKRGRLNSTSKFILILGGILILSIPLGAILKVGTFRILYFAAILFPILAGMLVIHLNGRRFIFPVVILSVVVMLAPLELYTCQPLIPSAKVILANLPADEPVGYVTQVNSIYQREMIYFALDYIRGRIAGDWLSNSQLVGLTTYNFSNTYLLWYYPLNTQVPKQTYEFFLIHIPGKSGTFGEKAEIRTHDLILSQIYNSSILYDNGESYVLHDKLR